MNPRLCLLIALALLSPLTLSTRGFPQTFHVIHTFTGIDGSFPQAGLTLDQAGSLYGTASRGGFGNGVAFRIKRSGSGWLFNPLYSFRGGDDGALPLGRLTIGPDGSIFGTTALGGSTCFSPGCGTVFNLKPPATFCGTALCPWRETVIHSFDGTDGSYPVAEISFDQFGDAYGSAAQGGANGAGAIYKLTKTAQSWTASVLHDFNFNDGQAPDSPLTLDAQGNLYGTTQFGGMGFCNPMGGACGTIFKLLPPGSDWTLSTLHTFDQQSDGEYPVSRVIFDQAGNLYGTTQFGGANGQGVAFEITSAGQFSVIYNFVGSADPNSGLTLDAAGNVYGTTLNGGAFQNGSVYKLSKTNGVWSYASLHDFTGGSDGRGPNCVVVFDASGNLYGTAELGGATCGGNGCGVVWQITPN
jgi:uncharacterized repeat protein (TIGR03803 family)